MAPDDSNESGPANGGQRYAPLDARVVLRGLRLVDGTGADPIAEAAIEIEGDRIAHVGKRAPFGPEVDLTGLTVLPGLIDAHSHLGLVDMTDMEGERSSLSVLAGTIFKVCGNAIDSGFTTVRDAGGVDGGLVKAIEMGLVRGPRIFPSGALLCQSAGHGDFRSPFANRHIDGHPGLVVPSVVVDGADEMRKAVRENFRRGATQIKVCVSGGVITSNEHENIDHPQLSLEELKVAVEEAAARDTYVMAHAHTLRGIRMGLEAGIKSFEHVTGLDDQTAAAMATAGAFAVPTLAVAHLMATEWREWGVPESAVERIRGIEQAMGRSLLMCVRAGVKVGSGSDLLGPKQDRRGLELVLRSHLIGPLTAVMSATRINAELMHISERLGTVSPGKIADLIAYDGDPLKDPELFDQPDKVVLVVKGGKIVKDLRGTRRVAPARERTTAAMPTQPPIQPRG